MILCVPASEQDVATTLQQRWEDLWPDVREQLKSLTKAYNLSEQLESDRWVAEAFWTKSAEFMGDKAELFLSIILDECPTWDFFIKSHKIMHCQPVF
jgi:hypothetical protein